ncbi:hypothetical protein ACHAWC_009494 [Mediolabrus comicus]
MAMQEEGDHGSVSDAAIGRALGSTANDFLSADGGPLHHQDDDNDELEMVTPTTTDERAKKKPLKEKLRQLPPTITNTYDNWTVDNSHNDGSDDIAWKIVKGILQGWCAIWVLFAIIIVAAEVASPKTPHQRLPNNNNIALSVTEEDEQLFLALAEKIVTKCAYANLATEIGREECQSLCHEHMCCFNDENNFGCANNSEKMCAAYAGCESLVVTEDDAIIYDANGVDVFGIGDNNDDDTLASNSSDNNKENHEQITQNGTLPYASKTSSELQMVAGIITTVCSTSNLHTRQQLDECASLCNDSMCCFDREQIEFLNPKMDLMLQLELGSGYHDKLDTSAMGTCMDDNEYFCQVHAACKNLLLLGSHYSEVDAPMSSHQDNTSGGNYIVFAILFAMVAAMTVYLLVFQRAAPVHVDVHRGISEAREVTREEMIEFV